MRRVAVLLVAALLAGCGGTSGGGVGRVRRDLERFVRATEREPRAFVYTERTPGAEPVVVRGEVADDLRFQGTVETTGREVLRQVVVDDAMAVQVLDASLWADELARIPPEDRPVLESIARGRWVLDYSAAPPLVAPRSREGAIVVGRYPVLDAAYVFQYVRRAISEAFRVEEFNPDDLEYDPEDDPFPKPDEGEGVRRYDLRPPPLPRRSQRGTAAALPTTAHFRKMAFYVRGGRVVRVSEVIDFESHRDFRRARANNGPEYLLELLASVREGKTREPLRLRRMDYRVEDFGAVAVDLPTGDVLPGKLTGLFGHGGASAAATPVP